MQNRKYLGMTLQQLAILGGLALVACLLFAATGLLFLRRGMTGLFAAAPQETPTTLTTPTTFVIPTLTSTATSAPVPYELLIPNGWKQFKTGLIEIWLPPAFKSTDKDADEELAAVGTNSKSSLYKMRVSVSFEPLTGDSLDTHVDNKLAKLDPMIRLSDRRKVSLNSSDAIRILFEGRVNSVDVDELAYLIQDGGTVWAVVYVAQINEFYEMLPSFERSAKTFRIAR